MDSVLNAPRNTPAAADPHAHPAWFELLTRTALPAEAVVSFVPLGPPHAPERAQLPLLRPSPHAHRLSALSTFYTPLFAPINAEQVDKTALLHYFRELRQRRAISMLQLAPLAPEAPFFALAHHTLHAAGWLTDRYFCFANWHADLDADDTADFASYWAARPSRLRNTVRRARRRLEASPGFALHVVEGRSTSDTDPDTDLSAAIAAFVSVYQRSWKAPEPYPDFIPGLCQLAAQQGWLRLGRLELDGQAVASQLWLVSGKCAYIVKLAYDRAYAAHAAGSVLSAHMMEYVIDRDHVRHIDYLIGDDAYKRDWTPLRRERCGLVAFNPLTLRGLAHAARHFGARRLKTLLSPLFRSQSTSQPS
jgi:hypothetical protein